MHKEIVVIKLGTSTLMRGTKHISRGKLEDVARQILILQKKYDVIIVSSGAIGVAKQFISLTGKNPIAIKQALAAIGQPALMKIYQEVFHDFGLHVAQCLLDYRDFNNDESRSNTINTIRTLLDNHYIPVINENDTVATEEIKFGDNDKLGALTASLIQAKILMIASDVDGLYTGDPREDENVQIVHEVKELSEIRHMVGDSISDQGTGGMKSKIMAAEICFRNGVEMWIVNGQRENFAIEAMEKRIDYTRFVPA